jgi:hypothetical protein
MHRVIEIRPHGPCWKVLEAAGVELIFPHKESAVLYATNLSRAECSEIRVFDLKGEIERLIPL